MIMFLSLLLWSCWVNQKLDNSTSSNFDRNLQCIDQKSEINKFVEYYLDISELNAENLNWETMIFYSPKNNSCVFSIWTELQIDQEITYSFRLFEYWINEEILIENYSCNIKNSLQCITENNNRIMDLVETYKK